MVASAVQVAKRALLATMHAVAIAFGEAMTCNRDSPDKDEGGVWGKNWVVGGDVGLGIPHWHQVDKSGRLQHLAQASIKLMKSIAVDPNSST